MRSGRSSPAFVTAGQRGAVGLFWVATATIAWTYAIFPLVTLLRGWLRPLPPTRVRGAPRVSIIVAAYNEERSIGAKIENLRNLEYPANLRQLIVASDGSDDRTEAIVRDAGGDVQLRALPRGGKAAALEAAVEAATGDVLVFTDANSLLADGALRAIVGPFGDPQVGGVAGDQRYGSSLDATERGERGYWALDRMLKQAGSRAGNAIAATGALYAIRRSLFRPIPAGVNDDYYLSAGVVEQGYRLVYEPGAVAVEPAAPSLDSEFSRKVRIMSRAFQTELQLRRLLDVRRYGFYSIQIFSHKILRRAAGVPLVVLAMSSAIAWRRGRLFQLATVAQIAAYASGLVGWFGHRRLRGPLRSAAALPGYFVMANTAALVALANLLRGRRIDRWGHQRSVGR